MDPTTGTTLVGPDRPARRDGSQAGSPPALRQRVESLRLPQGISGGVGVNWAAWSLCLLFAASTMVLAYVVFVRGAATSAVPARTAAETPGLAEAPAAPQASATASGGIVLDSKGYIIPVHQILVSPEVTGRIKKLKFVEGQRMSQGDLLAQLETDDFQHEVDRAEAALKAAQERLLEWKNTRHDEIGGAQAELEESEAQLVQLDAELKRTTELRQQNLLTAQDHELAQSKYRAMERRVERLRLARRLIESSREKRIAAAEAEVQQAEAELRKARWRLDKCTIRAPISGTILKKNAEEGNLVNPIAFNGSYSLCDMADLSELEVELSIQERDIAKVFQGQKCRVRAEAYPDRTYNGAVSRVMPIADRGKGAVPVRVRVSVPAEEEGKHLRPEMGAVVSFYREKPAGNQPQ